MTVYVNNKCVFDDKGNLKPCEGLDSILDSRKGIEIISLCDKKTLRPVGSALGFKTGEHRKGGIQMSYCPACGTDICSDARMAAVNKEPKQPKEFPPVTLESMRRFDHGERPQPGTNFIAFATDGSGCFLYWVRPDGVIFLAEGDWEADDMEQFISEHESFPFWCPMGTCYETLAEIRERKKDEK